MPKGCWFVDFPLSQTLLQRTSICPFLVELLIFHFPELKPKKSLYPMPKGCWFVDFPLSQALLLVSHAKRLLNCWLSTFPSSPAKNIYMSIPCWIVDFPLSKIKAQKILVSNAKRLLICWLSTFPSSPAKLSIRPFLVEMLIFHFPELKPKKS